MLDENLRVPNHTPILDTYIFEGLVDGTQLLDTLIQTLLSTGGKRWRQRFIPPGS